MRNNYNSIFSTINITNNLPKLKTLIGNNGYLMETPFYIFKQNDYNNRGSNQRFVNTLRQKIASHNEIYFLVYAKVNNNFQHAISCVINKTTGVLDMYDSNGEIGPAYFIGGLTHDMVGRGPGVYCPNSNMIYNITNTCIREVCPEIRNTTAHVDNRINPVFCPRELDGLCALWAFVYLMLRSHGRNASDSIYKINAISQLAINTNGYFDLLVSLKFLLSMYYDPTTKNTVNNFTKIQFQDAFNSITSQILK